MRKISGRCLAKAAAVLCMTAVLLPGCKHTELQLASPLQDEKRGITLSVTTMYAGDDGNSVNFKEAVDKWERDTGNTVVDNSVTSDEAFKARVIMDYQTGAEPDVLFYFTGVDSNPLVANRRVVPMEEIREVYPEYASNMREELIQPSPYDGRIYCIPVNGYWEGLFVNRKICAEVGIQVPDENTTWDEFMDMCEAVRKAGYVPIAASLVNVPHYWFEFCIFNYQNALTHAILPQSVDDPQGRAWVQGLTMIKTMYERGFFPTNTLSSSDDETTRMFIDGQAAFLLDGSWRMSGVERSVANIDDYTVTYVPGSGQRRATDIISGLSTGYYISRKAWEDPEKRDAVVSFVEYMTTDEMVSKFAEVAATALVNGVQVDRSKLSSLACAAIDMTEGVTATAEAVQDYVPVDCRVPVFEGMPAIVRGEKDITEAVREVLELIKAKK